MTKLEILRLGTWALPLSLSGLAILVTRPSRDRLAALLPAFSWNLWAILAVNLVAIHQGWWSFSPGLVTFLGVPAEPLFGWVILWGVLGPLLALDRSIAMVVLMMLWVDLVAMPSIEPLGELSPNWLVGEGFAIGSALIPGLLIARWTYERKHLHLRAGLQVVCVTAIFLWLVPTAAFERSGGWGPVLARPIWRHLITVQLLLLPIAMGLRSVKEFVMRGRGTPTPYDSPTKLVNSGPYSFVSNPMQLSMVLVYVIAGIDLRNWWLLAAGVVAYAYSEGLARWHEEEQLGSRFGDGWHLYRSAVRAWLPRWRPVAMSGSTLFVAYSCATCSSIGRWFTARQPLGLTISPAEEVADRRALRVTYESQDGVRSEGVAAIARALEHINFGWAAVGWVLGLPGIARFAQLIADLFGPGPQDVRGRGYDAQACQPSRSRV